MDLRTERYYQGDRNRTNYSGDDLLVAVVIFLVFCLICLLLWISSPHLALRVADYREQMAREPRIVFNFGPDERDWFEEVVARDDWPDRRAGDIRDRLHEEIEMEEQQALQDAGEPEQDATVRLQNAVEEHFREMMQHANDGQNVHDQVIVKSLSIKYRRMLELRIRDPEHKEFVARLVSQNYKVKDIREMESEQALREIRVHAKEHVTDPEKLRRINTVLDETNRGATSISLTGRPVKDLWVLTLVWKRIHHRDNAKNASDMCGILMDQLNDAATRDTDILGLGTGTVCIGGRIGRIMSVLTRMDSDEALARPELDVKELTNEAAAKCAQLIKVISEANPTLATLYTQLPENLTEAQQEEVARFEEYIKSRIDESLRIDYRDLLPSKELDRLITKMQAGIGI